MKKLLVANRSEIAIRVFRSATELGYRTVALYAHEDRFCTHRFKADESYMIGADKGPIGAYLDIPSIIDLARDKGVDAIHPGYGFLSENAHFARACREAGIEFIGPGPELLEQMGDKVKARALAEKAGVPTLPGTKDPVSDIDEAAEIAQSIGFPLIIKAAHGGGGRGMRICREPERLRSLLEEAQSEAQTAFGNPEVFLERYVARAKHLEVQLIGDQHGNVMHLWERDCSVQRRHQKVVEIAPSVALPERVRHELCDAALRLGQEIGYYGAGTVEFLFDQDTSEWFFIEMNPRIQVEHTVTEVITGIDIVRAQILISEKEKLQGETIGLPPQDEVPRNGYAIQCRVTTEDPENNFTPDYGRIQNYRSPAGFGVRLDGGMAANGAVITPFYDSLLVKISCSGATFEQACQRTDRALREIRIRGVKTNIPFVENVIAHPIFRSGQASTTLIDTTPELFHFQPRRDRATKLLKLIAETSVNGNEQVKGRAKPDTTLPVIVPSYDHSQPIPKGTRDILLENGPQGLAEWTRKQTALLVTDTTLRDAHQSLLAARLRSYDMLKIADVLARRAPQLFSLEMWGGATFDTCLRFLKEDPFERLRTLREHIPNILFQMLLRGANGVGYTNYPDNVVRGFVKHSAEAGMDVFRIFDSLNYLPNLKVAMEAVQETHAICEGTVCYTGEILDPKRDKYDLKYYVEIAQELERMGAHILAIKDMSGLCTPFAAERLVSTLQSEVSIPLHFHTHDTSGVASSSVIKASEAGVDVVDLAIASLSGLTAQPNLNSIVNALEYSERNTGLDLAFLDELTIYWEAVRQYYAPFDTAPKFGNAQVYLHEMPGGQYTNLREQAAALGLGKRWPEVVRYYHEVNELFGDIVKVTPSSKVVGDMAMFLLTHGIEPKDVVNLEPGSLAFPNSVVDMMMGGLGQPKGGWPADVQRVILGDKPPREGRPGDFAEPIDLDAERAKLEPLLGRVPTEDELYCHLMYPEVFEQFVEFVKKYDHATVLPTLPFFYGLEAGEEISVDIEEGKTLIIKLTHIGEADDKGNRTAFFELNGRPRETVVHDNAMAVSEQARPLADPGDPQQVGAPMPGVISNIYVSVGKKVQKGDRLLVLEAMKMQSSVYASADGTIGEVCVEAGDSVQAKELLLRLQ